METNQSAPYITESYPTTVTEAKYATSLDERGFIPVFEYEINGQAILWDRETRYVFLTGIWKALGHTKVDVIKTVQANPGLKTKRIRGGLLKIQGTWIPYQDARSLCLRAAWIIRQQLIPLFGTNFVEECLPPHHPNYRVVCLDYLQSTPDHFSKNPLLTKKRRYIIRPPSTPPSHYVSSSSSPLHPQSPFIPSIQSSSSSPMALSRILNSDDKYDDENTEDIGWTDYDNKNDAGMTDDGVVPVTDDEDMFGPDASPTLAFQVVPLHCSLLDGPSSALALSPLSNDWPTFNNMDSTFFDDLDGACIWGENGLQESIETIQATILLQGLSHQDRLTTRETVPDKVMVDGREFSVLWE